MNAIFVLIALVWAIRIIANIISWTSLWWMKEYRMDRMGIHLRTKQGAKILFPQFRLPPRSIRSISVITGSIITSVYLYVLLGESALSLVMVDLLSFPVTALIVFLSYVPVTLYHTVRIWQATRLMRSRSDLLVIGITGSYGKTSTKEYLSTILSQNLETLKTDASKNSPIGIAEIVLRRLKPDHKVFVVEMGAYKLGEIRAMCEIVKPQIGVILAINPQHQDLFGTIETTMKAKYELIENLSGKNIAVLNYDDARVRTLAEWATRDGHTVWCVTKESQENLSFPVYEISDVDSTNSRLRFHVAHDKENLAVSVPIIGAHQATNITAAIAASVAAGVSFEKSVASTKKLMRVSHVLEAKDGIHGSTFIDDTFNNNPDAAKAAIAVLANYKKGKILVFQPMIELGTYAQSSHYEVGRVAGEVCDEVILVGEDWSEDFIKGVRSTDSGCVVQVLGVDKAAGYLRTHTKASDTVLFKGKSAGLVLTRIFSQ